MEYESLFKQERIYFSATALVKKRLQLIAMHKNLHN